MNEGFAHYMQYFAARHALNNVNTDNNSDNSPDNNNVNNTDNNNNDIVDVFILRGLHPALEKGIFYSNLQNITKNIWNVLFKVGGGSWDTRGYIKFYTFGYG